MDFRTNYLPTSNEPTFPSPMLRPTTFGQPDELRLASGESYMPLSGEAYMLASPDAFLAPGAPVPENPFAPGLASGESYMLPASDAFVALNAPSQNTALSDDTVEVANVSIAPPARPRKKKTATLKARDWDCTSPTLNSFTAMACRSRRLRQYRYRITQWGLEKNVKPQEMKAIVRKWQNRKLIETNKRELAFTVRGQEVDPQKIDRWSRRNDISKSQLYGPSPATSTPSAILCRTVSEHGSAYVSPASVGRTPNIPGEGIASTPYSPQAFSLARSDLTIIHSASNFTGQSPAPFRQPLSSLARGAISAQNASLESPALLQPTHTDDTPQALDARSLSIDPGQYRYRQMEEDRLKEDLASMRIFYGLGHPNTLQKVIREAVNAYLDDSNKNGIGMLNAVSLLGRLLLLQGFYSQAVTVQKEVLAKRKRILGDEHPDTITAMRDLALKIEAKNKGYIGISHNKIRIGNEDELDMAAEMNREVFEKRQRIFGNEDLRTITAMGNLANSLGNQDEFDEAIALQRETLENMKRIIGDEHPHTIFVMNNHAMALCDKGEFGAAAAIQEEVLEKGKRILRDGHPYMTFFTQNLKKIFRDQLEGGRSSDVESRHNFGSRVSEVMG